MRLYLIIFPLMIDAAIATGQNSASTLPELPKDPRAMLSAARPLYNYNDPALKPWHLAATYQLFDEAGNPAQQGKYEFSWKQPGVYRSTWSREGVTHTEWRTGEGKAFRKSAGDRLFYFEHAIQDLLLRPIPDQTLVDKKELDVMSSQLEINGFKLPCAETRANPQEKSPFNAATQDYCFDSSKPVLRIEHLFSSIYVQFNDLTMLQNRVLPRAITIADRRHKFLSLKIETVGDLGDDQSMVPAPDAVPFAASDGAVSEKLIDKVAPIYPPGALVERISGTVTLDVMIGKDGKMGDMRVLSTPSPMLVPASKYAVSQWRYAPYLVDGQPQEVNTIINVVFSLRP